MGSQQMEPGTTGVYMALWIAPVRGIAVSLHLVALAWVLLTGLTGAPVQTWPIVSLLLVATLATFTSLLRTLPLANVVAAFTLSGLIGALAHSAGKHFGISPLFDESRRILTPPLPEHLVAAMIWIVSLFASRGVARFILRRTGQEGWRGICVIGLTGLLAMLFDLGLQSAATPAGSLEWNPTTLVSASVRGVLSIVTLILLTPWLINKKPTPETPDPHPVIIWCSLIALFGGAAAVRGAKLLPSLLAATALAAALLVGRAILCRRRPRQMRPQPPGGTAKNGSPSRHVGGRAGDR